VGLGYTLCGQNLGSEGFKVIALRVVTSNPLPEPETGRDGTNHGTMIGEDLGVACSKLHGSDTPGKANLHIMAGQEDEKSIIVAVKGTATGKFVPTGAANRERKKANLAAKKNYKKQKASKEPLKGKDDYPALDEGKVSEGKLEVKDDREIVVHPWHLSDQKHVIQGDHVILDSGRYRIADFSDNLEGERLFRRITGPGTVLLPRVWGNFHYIQEACAPLVAEALGKVDVDLKYLIPRAIVNLKTRIPVWPGVENELFEYLTSTEFTNKVQRHYTERLGKSRTILTAKCLRFAAKINASALDV